MENVNDVSEILKEKLWIARPLQTIKEDDTRNNITRLNIVTDDIGKNSLFGGVATSLILATMLCNRNNWILRIITRWTPCNVNDYFKFTQVYGIKSPNKVETYSDEDGKGKTITEKLPVGPNDVFLATSWWSAKSILESRLNRRIMYIIQEEETFFYPYSDERFWCEEIMHNDQIDFIVNSKLLYDYLKNNKYNTLIEHGMYFEPAFSDKLYYPDEKTFEKKRTEKRKMFFYGRPKNPRNLYYFGLECLDEALKRGVIDTDLWDIYLAGYDIEKIRFSNGYIPKMNGVMSWNEYADFARTVDLSFSLMYTPHPSYPPFDMLCSGAVVLTNEFKNKKELQYSPNMILAKLNKKDIVDKMETAIKLAENTNERKENYLHNKINRDWNVSFKDVVTVLEQRIEEGCYV